MKIVGSSTMDMFTALLEAFWSLITSLLVLTLAEAKLLKVPQNTTVAEGEKIRLECTTDLDLPVYWYHDGKEIYAGGAVSMRYKQFYNVTKQNPGEHSLEIESATQSHNGVYTCGDDEGAGEKRSAYVKVTEPTAVLYPTLMPTQPMNTEFVTSGETEHAAPGTSTLTAIIVTVVLLGVILISIIIATILFVYFRRQRNSRQNEKEEKKTSPAGDELLQPRSPR